MMRMLDLLGREKRVRDNKSNGISWASLEEPGAIGAVVARFVHTEEVTGSNPVSPTKFSTRFDQPSESAERVRGAPASANPVLQDDGMTIGASVPAESERFRAVLLAHVLIFVLFNRTEMS